MKFLARFFACLTASISSAIVTIAVILCISTPILLFVAVLHTASAPVQRVRLADRLFAQMSTRPLPVGQQADTFYQRLATDALAAADAFIAEQKTRSVNELAERIFTVMVATRVMPIGQQADTFYRRVAQDAFVAADGFSAAVQAEQQAEGQKVKSATLEFDINTQ